MKKQRKTERLHITTHGGKLEGLRSISTSRRLNPLCQKRAEDPNSICHYCYAETYLKLRENLRKALERNTRELCGVDLIPYDELPIINDLYFRFEAFGDLINTNQVINYFNIAKKNEKTTFALWTKNPWEIEDAIKRGNEKPDNLIIVYSVSVLNGTTPDILAKFKEAWPCIDKFFTVYDKTYIEGHNVNINCGGRKCIECLNCYKKNDIAIINEKLK